MTGPPSVLGYCATVTANAQSRSGSSIMGSRVRWTWVQMWDPSVTPACLSSEPLSWVKWNCYGLDLRGASVWGIGSGAGSWKV